MSISSVKRLQQEQPLEMLKVPEPPCLRSAQLFLQAPPTTANALQIENVLLGLVQAFWVHSHVSTWFASESTLTVDSPPRRVKLLLPHLPAQAKAHLGVAPGTRTALVGVRPALWEFVEYRQQAWAAEVVPEALAQETRVLEALAPEAALEAQARVPEVLGRVLALEAQVPEAQVVEAAPGAWASTLEALVPEARDRVLALALEVSGTGSGTGSSGTGSDGACQRASDCLASVNRLCVAGLCICLNGVCSPS